MCGKLQGELPKVSAQGDSSPVPAARQQDNRPRVLLALKRGQIPPTLRSCLRTSLESPKSDPEPLSSESDPELRISFFSTS